MRVLMLSWEYPPHLVGGLGKHVVELVGALASEGVEVHVVTPNFDNAPAHEPLAMCAMLHRVEVIQRTSADHDWLAFVDGVNEQMAHNVQTLQAVFGPFDLVHSHDWLVAKSGVAVKYAYHIPLIATMHGTERGRWQGHLGSREAHAIASKEWWFTYEAWRVITVSRYMCEQLEADFQLPESKIDVIPNGVTLPTVQMLSQHERAVFRRRWAKDDEPIIFYVGRIVHEKGIHVLIDAIGDIVEHHPGVRLIVAGTGPIRDDLRRQACDLGVDSYVHFTGFISDQDRDRLFEVADVAVFPSLYEPFGIVALEAMAHRCPVVVAATGGLNEVVRLYENGMTAHPGDAASLAWAINVTLDRPAEAQQRVERAWHEVQQRYEWRHIARITLDVYQRVREEWRRSDWAAPQIEQVS